MMKFSQYYLIGIVIMLFAMLLNFLNCNSWERCYAGPESYHRRAMLNKHLGF